jgi:hypothetical protein
LQKYADSLTEVGRLDDALKVQRYSLRVVERKYGAAGVRYAAQLESVGRWYARIGSYDASRAALRRAIEIVETANGVNATELIGPLTALADCDRRQLLDSSQRDLSSADDMRRSMFHDPMAPLGPTLSASTINSEGQKALERAVGIASSRPDPSPVQLADVRTQLGDWFQSQKQFYSNTSLRGSRRPARRSVASLWPSSCSAGRCCCTTSRRPPGTAISENLRARPWCGPPRSSLR